METLIEVLFLEVIFNLLRDISYIVLTNSYLKLEEFLLIDPLLTNKIK